MLTARDQSSDRDIAMRAGATSYMSKPFDADRLVMTVDQMISDDQQKHARFSSQR
jgi:DNA-binding response OmpR family regulator